MVWTAQTSKGYEAQKCRYRVASFLRGRGLDIGCGSEKVCKEAIGIDVAPGADITLDLSADRALDLFGDGAFDYVFSSHCLEDFNCTAAILKEWWRVIRPGGYLVLYLPDRKFYPQKGTAGANPNHQHDFEWPDIWAILKKFGNVKLISATEHSESNEYSFQMVCQKTFGLYKGYCSGCPYTKSSVWRFSRDILDRLLRRRLV